MFKHLFKLIWNKKKQNLLLMIEILVSFLVIFAVFTMLVYYYKNYRRPMNFEYEQVWSIGFKMQDRPKASDSAYLFFEALKNQIKSMPEIEQISFSSHNVPFALSNTQNSVDFEGQNFQRINDYTVSDDHAKVLQLSLQSGRWFSKQDDASRYQPVVINSLLKERIFGNVEAVGQVFNKKSDHPLIVVGVINDIKDKGDYQDIESAIFRRTDSSAYSWIEQALVRVKPGTGIAFEGRLYKALASHMPNATIEIEHLSNKRVSKNNLTLVPIIIMMVVAGFLVINVALGLFGVLWYNINRRKAEIGLRRAIGAPAGSISWQLVSESIVLATLALIVGCFFAVQFPLLNVFDLPASVYIYAILLAVLFVYLLVIICSLYPGKQAAAIYPAVALHED